MKLSGAFLIGLAHGQTRSERMAYRALSAEKNRSFKPERFIYEWPMCLDIDSCRDNNKGCDGRLVDGALEATGKIEHRAYSDRWNCRWEIKEHVLTCKK